MSHMKYSVHVALINESAGCIERTCFSALGTAGRAAGRVPRTWSGSAKGGSRAGSGRCFSPASRHSEDDTMEWTVDLTIIPRELMQRSKVQGKARILGAQWVE